MKTQGYLIGCSILCGTGESIFSILESPEKTFGGTATFKNRFDRNILWTSVGKFIELDYVENTNIINILSINKDVLPTFSLPENIELERSILG